jgi:hypothetical protein
MAVRDDRSDVRQTTTGFRGPLMVQSLTSAKSKFLSLSLTSAKIKFLSLGFDSISRLTYRSVTNRGLRVAQQTCSPEA